MNHIEKLCWIYPSIPRSLVEEILLNEPDKDGFVYSNDGKRLLMAADTKEYYIREGVEKIEPSALFGCKIDVLHVPYTCTLQMEEFSEDDYPIWNDESGIGDVRFWDVPYADVDRSTNSLLGGDDDYVFDKYKVAYSRNGKRLLFARMDFDMTEYTVRDGVETICSYAFYGITCNSNFLKLYIPSSVKYIGLDIFSEAGGSIEVISETMSDNVG